MVTQMLQMLRISPALFAPAGLAALVVLVALAAGPVLAEHPTEHPKEHPKEHPAEHPASKKTGRLTKDDLARAIETHVKKSSAASGDFLVEDPVTGQTLRLSLDKVHKERLSRVGENRYFACADFTTDDGITYDLDLFMVGSSADKLSFSDLSVHKKNGQARYGWVLKGGLWTKSSAD